MLPFQGANVTMILSLYPLSCPLGKYYYDASFLPTWLPFDHLHIKKRPYGRFFILCIYFILYSHIAKAAMFEPVANRCILIPLLQFKLFCHLMQGLNSFPILL